MSAALLNDYIQAFFDLRHDARSELTPDEYVEWHEEVCKKLGRDEFGVCGSPDPG